MSVRRGPITALIAVVCMLAAMLAFSASASAAPGYGGSAPTVGVSTTNPGVGATITVSGAHFQPGETVNITLESGGYGLGSVTANRNGAFSTRVTLPAGVTGPRTIVSTGETSGDTASIAITIGATGSPSGNGGVASGGGSGSGGLSNTGVAAAGIGGFGVLLLLGGGLMLMLGRRRRVDA